jgi:hypothetical protein
MTPAERRQRRAVFRPSWRALAPNRSMQWWQAFAMAVKQKRIRHSDTEALRALVPIIDATPRRHHHRRNHAHD